MVTGSVRVGHEDRRQAVRGELEHRATGARDHEIGGGERLGKVRLRQVLAQVVAGGKGAGGERAVVTAAAHVQHVKARAGERG